MPTPKHQQKPPLPLWVVILLLIALAFVIVILFAAFIFLFVGGAQQLGLSTTGQIVIFMAISGIFAWLLKRISDAASAAGHLWFADESDSPPAEEPPQD